MNTFLPYCSFERSSKVLDMKRLGKQRVECLQLLNCLEKGPLICCVCRESINYKNSNDCACPTGDGPHNPIKTPWYSHPCTQMWIGFEGTLASYGIYFCKEWIRRGYKDNIQHKLIEHLIKWNKNIGDPPFIGNENFHLSMQSNLIRKDPIYYKPIFGNNVPDNLPYVWKI